MIFIIVEGADGAGKTTFTEDLVDHLEQNQDVVRLKFPTRLPTDEELERKTSEVLFYLNDFEREMAKLEGFDGIVVCDRSFITTLAYQGFDSANNKNQFFDPIMNIGYASFFKDVKADIYIVELECDVEESLRRTGVRSEGKSIEDLDRVDRMGVTEKRAMITSLKERYSKVMIDLKVHFGRAQQEKILNPRFLSIHTTDLDPVDALNEFLFILRQDKLA